MRKIVDNIISKILVILMSIMVINVLWQVFTRFIMNSPSSFTDELARYLLIWVGVLGIAYTSGHKLHLALDLIPKRWGENFHKRLNGFTYILIIAFSFFVLVIGGIRLVYVTYVLEQDSAALQIPLAYIYAIIPFSGILIIYYKISDLLIPNND